MLFNSLQFAIFFPLVVVLFFGLPQRLRLPMLLVASCVFYMAFIPAYIAILFVTIGIDYIAGLYLERWEGAARRVLLVMSIISTCAVLFIFKYFDFVVGNFTGLAGIFGWHVSKPLVHIILPIGLSFHTFQSLSYVIEVYRGEQRAERSFLTYATYVMFFPQLVAGPIERPQNLLHQFREVHAFDVDRITSGLKRMAWGFFKKLVVADRLALYVNDVYAAPQSFNGLQLTIATFFFAYQIYCDFSAYSDIAVGAARVLGFRLMENFRTPYHSKSISEFWHRWHISLSTWFRDYLYFPMGGSRVNQWRWCFNILVTFAISGLWHGANWTYVAWGALNGFYILAGRATADWRNRLLGAIGLVQGTPVRGALSMGATFFLTCVAWVIFRAASLQDAGYILTHFWSNWDFSTIKTEQFLLRQMPVALGAIVILETVQFLNGRVRLVGLLRPVPRVARWGIYATFVFTVILFGVFRNSQFIYFQF